MLNDRRIAKALQRRRPGTAQRPVRPTRRATVSAERQRFRVHGEQGPPVADAGRRDDAVHRAWQSLGKRLRRELQRQAARRAVGPRTVRYVAGGQGAYRALAAPVQHAPAAQLVGLPAARARGDRASFVRFGYASANEAGWRWDTPNSNLTTGSTRGVRS